MASETLFLNNLPANITRRCLYDLCCQAGPVAEIRLPKDHAGAHRGYGFCQYYDTESAAYALALFEGHVTLYGKPLALRYSHPKPGAAAGASPALALPATGTPPLSSAELSALERMKAAAKASDARTQAPHLHHPPSSSLQPHQHYHVQPQHSPASFVLPPGSVILNSTQNQTTHSAIQSSASAPSPTMVPTHAQPHVIHPPPQMGQYQHAVPPQQQPPSWGMASQYQAPQPQAQAPWGQPHMHTLPPPHMQQHNSYGAVYPQSTPPQYHMQHAQTQQPMQLQQPMQPQQSLLGAYQPSTQAPLPTESPNAPPPPPTLPPPV